MSTTHYVAHVGGERVEVSVESTAQGCLVRCNDGEPKRLHVEEHDGILRLVLDGKPMRLGHLRRRGTHLIVHQGHVHEVTVESAVLERFRAMLPETAGGGGRHSIQAPIPGLVTEVRVQEGQPVEAGETVVVLYAMKLENEITAPQAGVVRAVHTSPQDAVEKGDCLVEIEG